MIRQTYIIAFILFFTLFPISLDFVGSNPDLVGVPVVMAQVEGVPAGAAPQRSFMEVFLSQLPLFILVWLVFYFLVLRPQTKKQDSQRKLLESLKNGEQVVTSSGIIARVASVETASGYITLEVSSGVKVKFEPHQIVKRFDSAEAKKSAADSTGEQKQKSKGAGKK